MEAVCQGQQSQIQLIQKFTPDTKLVFEALVRRVNRYGNSLKIIVKRLAKELGICPRTVSRALATFTAYGIIQKENVVESGWKTGVRITLTSYFSLPVVRYAMYKTVGIVTNFLIEIKMLWSALSPLFYKNKIKNLNPAGRIRELDRDCISQEKVGVGKKMTENLARKVLCIEAGLLERGEDADVLDTPKLLAFSEACLDHAAKEMKLSRPRHPFSYFMKLCFDYSKANGEKPDFALADSVRADKSLDKYRPSVTANLAVRKAERQEKERHGTAKKTYSETVQENKDTQQRLQTKSQENLDAAIERRRAQNSHYWKPLSEEEKNRLNLDNPYFKLLVQAQIDRLSKLEWGSEEAESIRKQLGEWGMGI